MLYLDEFLPFSLLHSRADQYRFSGTRPASGNEEVDPVGHDVHHQFFLDDLHRSFISDVSPEYGDNVTQREVQKPYYDEEQILNLIHMGVSNKTWLDYSQVIEDHSIKPTVATADGAREALLQHLFSGRCTSCQKPGSVNVVVNENCLISMGVKMIDLVTEWFDNGKLSVRDLAIICKSIGIVPSATKQKRLLLSKLTIHRRDLICELDTATSTLPDIVHNLGSSSKLETLRALCGAHCMHSHEGGKECLTDNFFDHITNGICAEKTGPGCENVMRQVAPLVDDVIHTQVDVLRHIHSLLSARQVRRVLDLHEIK
jgi:hypothetical protein